jgi:hypothetical protein
MRPPRAAIDAAVAASRLSPCAKSKRGAAVFRRYQSEDVVVASNWNRPPMPRACDGTESCRRDCAKICSHAEQTAIASALVGNGGEYLSGFTLIHAKTVNGALVSGGGPSCWQCSRLILEVEFEGVWLYETTPIGMEGVTDEWIYYSAREFHRATLKACDLHNAEAAP